MKAKSKIILITSLAIVLVAVATALLCVFLIPTQYSLDGDKIVLTYIKQSSQFDNDVLPEVKSATLDADKKQTLTNLLQKYPMYYSGNQSATTATFDDEYHYIVKIDIYKDKLIKSYQISSGNSVLLTQYEKNGAKQKYFDLRLDKTQIKTLINELQKIVE